MTAKIAAFVVLAFSIGLGACAPTGSLVSHKRSPDFYQKFVNSSQDEAKAAEKIGGMKLLHTGDEFPIRAVLFDNGKFFYTVDRLGDGYGTWEYKEGGLELKAKRPIFDVQFVVSAQDADGEATVIQFVDRFGFASYPLSVRDPGSLKKQGQTPPPLNEFSKSKKDI